MSLQEWRSTPTAFSRGRRRRAHGGRSSDLTVGVEKAVGVVLTLVYADGKAVGIGSQGYADGKAVGIDMIFFLFFI